MEEEQGEIRLMDELAQYVSAAKTGLLLQFGSGWQKDSSERNAPSQLSSELVIHWILVNHLMWKEKQPKVRIYIDSQTVASTSPVYNLE